MADEGIVLTTVIEAAQAEVQIQTAGFLSDLLELGADEGRTLVVQHKPGDPMPALPSPDYVKIPLDMGALGDFYAIPAIAAEVL